MTPMTAKVKNIYFVAFCSFLLVASLFATEVDNEKVGYTIKSSRGGQQNISFIIQPDFNVDISPKNVAKHLVATVAHQTFWFKLNF